MEQTELREIAVSWRDRARQLAVIDEQSCNSAGEALKAIKAERDRIEEDYGPEIRRRFEAHREATAARKWVDSPLEEAEVILKAAIATYQNEQRRLAQERERAELQRLEREAELAREAEIEQAEADGASKAEIAEIVQRPLEVPAMVYVAPRPAKVAGVSMRDNWKAVVTDMLALVRYCGNNPDKLNLLEPNTTALGQQAKSLKSAMKIPGVRVYNEPVVAAGRR